MKQLLMIAAAEWRYWLRSYLLLGGVAVFALIIMSTSIFTAWRMDAENHVRMHQQQKAEETFLAQPDRHPHRMVHYGHYVFRNPAPLALFDPGIDTVTGQSIFLEGHRQNASMFAESSASADFGGVAWLTPALVYQLFAPLLLILFGYNTIVREREAKVLGPLLAQGIKGYTIIFGKALAFLPLILLLLSPLCISGLMAIGNDESLFSVVSLIAVYFMYLAVWTALTLVVSASLKTRSNVLAMLSALWLGITLVLPSIMVDIAVQQIPLAGKIESDLLMMVERRKLGDGHNANDPAFAQLRANLLKEYNVEKIEDLPINFRGVIAQNSEKKLTELMNRYAAIRMDAEAHQAKRLSEYAVFTPTLAIAEISRALSGTDLFHYHRFLQEAEALRFDFVQGLNEAHIKKLTYEDDINRNKDEVAGRRARVDASNWEVLDTYVFEPATLSTRIASASNAIIVLIVWLLMAVGGLFLSARSLTP